MAGAGLTVPAPRVSGDPSVWVGRAAEAERSVAHRHLHRPWFAPWAWLAWPAYPPAPEHRTFVSFYYWWQAHVLETLVDAQLRAPTARRRRVIARWPAAMALRNRGRWLNHFHDDIGWFGLALDRMERDLGMDVHRPLAAVTTTLEAAWDDEPLGGGIPWRIGDEFRNVPATGPMTILLARRGRSERAREALDWMNRYCLDAETGLVVDGLRPGPPGTPPQVDRAFHTYNQGLLLGAEVAVLRAAMALGAAGPEDVAATAERVHRLVVAVDEHLAVDHVVTGRPGPPVSGDSGLFAGILARYLARVVTDLPGDGPASADVRGLAATLLRATAEATWRHRATDADGTWFGPDPRTPARIPQAGDAGAGRGGEASPSVPERDLSVQVGAWMLLEAAARAL